MFAKLPIAGNTAGLHTGSLRTLCSAFHRMRNLKAPTAAWLLCTLLPVRSPAQAGSGMIPPLDIPMFLSGNFMELRSDHFHSGLDIKTNGVEGLPVRAVKDGYVARIKVSPWGYGKALYLQHPDGTTTVYGHLQRYAGAIADHVLEAQYAAHDFSIDNYPDAGKLPVKQGDVIAYSGNSGGSSGPHLHFEVRNGDQHALDPEAHGIDLVDNLAPELRGLRVYPLDGTSAAMPYPAGAKGFPLVKGSSGYRLKQDTVDAHGTIAFALNVVDKYNGTTNDCGPRKLELFVDNKPFFTVALDHIDFGVQRFCNAHTDYGLFKDNDLQYQRLYKLPTNKLRIYGKEPEQGRLTVEPGSFHRVRILATDANGNTSQLSFTVRGVEAEKAVTWLPKEGSGTLMKAGLENRYDGAGIRVILPPDALYEDILFTHAAKPKPQRTFSPLHAVHSSTTPLHVSATISLKADSVPAALTAKALVMRSGPKGKSSAHGGTWEKGWVRTTVKSFGDYYVAIDTVPPTITPIGLRSSMAGRAGFALRVSDNLSGLEKWHGTLNGEWILLEFDPKAKSLSHQFDKYTDKKGRQTLKVDVQDERGNLRSFSYTFTR